jgi:hypothetical protein
MYSVLEHKHSTTLVSCILNRTSFTSWTRNKMNVAVFAMSLLSRFIPVNIMTAPHYFCTRCDCPQMEQEIANTKKKAK